MKKGIIDDTFLFYMLILFINKRYNRQAADFHDLRLVFLRFLTFGMLFALLICKFFVNETPTLKMQRRRIFGTFAITEKYSIDISQYNLHFQCIIRTFLGFLRLILTSFLI